MRVGQPCTVGQWHHLAFFFIFENSDFLFVFVKYYLKFMYDKLFLPTLPVGQFIGLFSYKQKRGTHDTPIFFFNSYFWLVESHKKIGRVMSSPFNT